MNKRGEDLFFVKRAKTERYKKSAIVSMQRLLNMEASKQQALRNSCELLRRRNELHASSCNCMQAYVTACKLM